MNLSKIHLRQPLVGLLIALSISVLPQPVKAAQTPDIYYRQMIIKVKSLKTYQVNIKETIVLQPTVAGAKARTIDSTSQIVYESPNLFSLKNNGLMGGVSVVSDGKQEFFYSGITQEYAIAPAPADVLGGALAGFPSKQVDWNSVSLTKLDGISVLELRGAINSGRGLTGVTFYIRQSNSLPFEAVIALPSLSSPNGSGLSITRTELFTDQRINLPVQDSTFKISPPDGATRVDSVADLTSGIGGGGLQ